MKKMDRDNLMNAKEDDVIMEKSENDLLNDSMVDEDEFNNQINAIESSVTPISSATPSNMFESFDNKLKKISQRSSFNMKNGSPSK
jgi:hypothetical protein